MTDFASIKRPASRRQPNVHPAPGRRVGLGDVQPGVVSSGHLRPFDSSSFTLDRAVSAYLQPGTAAFSVGAGAVQVPQWGAPANAERLAVRIGYTPVALTLVAHASFGWANNSAFDIHGRACFTLFDGPIGTLGTGGHAFSRSIDIPATFVPKDGHFYQLHLASLITVPYSDTADWHVGISMQNDLGSSSSSQVVNRQKIVIFSAGPKPGFTDTTVADGALA